MRSNYTNKSEITSRTDHYVTKKVKQNKGKKNNTSWTVILNLIWGHVYRTTFLFSPSYLLQIPLPEEIHWSPGDSKLHDMSAEEVANQLVVFDWELFSCVHEVRTLRPSNHQQRFSLKHKHVHTLP